MNLSELFQDLSFGELSSLALADSGTGLITDAGKERVIRFANDALLKLYGRFVLKQNDVVIELSESITNYHLLKEFAQSQSGISAQTTLYIQDTVEEPFQEDVLRIMSVFSDAKGELPLNDENDHRSVFTPQPLVIQVPDVKVGNALSITYQSKPELLTLADLTQEVPLPRVLHSAMRSWIAYRAFAQINTQEAVGIAQMHQQAYEGECAEVVDRDLLGQSVSQANKRFRQNGWV